jgi:hypothetical protein
LKRRTLTNLYNAQPSWLSSAHKKLDDAVASAYNCSAELSDEQILGFLLKENLARKPLLSLIEDESDEDNINNENSDDQS